MSWTLRAERLCSVRFSIGTRCVRTWMGRSFTAFAWGNADDGRLGVTEGIVEDRGGTLGYSVYAPMPVALYEDISSMACGAAHSVFLASSGAVYTVGLGQHGQLGHGSTEALAVPRRVEGVPPCRAVAAGGAHTLMLTMEGEPLVCGAASSGALGIGDVNGNLDRPSAMRLPEYARGRVTAVAAGGDFSVLLLEDGSVMTCGALDYGKLGYDSHVPDTGPDDPTPPRRIRIRIPLPSWRRPVQPVPRAVDGLTGVEHIFCGPAQTIVLDRHGAALGFGSNNHGLLATDHQSYLTKPIPVGVLH
mmetsp:Transcript_17753/g.36865  ORF Transcript_17753/g.36865 Transcript_17753/m.36865 type:complete len:303 (-) Transcript_17753:1930-2838(-)